MINRPEIAPKITTVKNPPDLFEDRAVFDELIRKNRQLVTENNQLKRENSDLRDVIEKFKSEEKYFE